MLIRTRLWLTTRAGANQRFSDYPKMNESVIQTLSRLARAAAVVVLLVGGCGLLGWITGNEYLTSLFPNGIAMKANAALGLMLSGLSLLLSVGRWNTSAASRLVAKASASLVVMLGGFTLTEHVTGFDLGIDQLLFTEPAGAPGTASPGRMGPPASASFLLGGIALLLLHNDGRRSRLLAQSLGICVFAIASIPLIGYAYQLDYLYVLPRYTGIALHTAAALLLLGTGIVLAQPRLGIVAIIFAADAGGLMARRLILPALLLPFVTSWVRAISANEGWFSVATSRPYSILFLSVCSVLLILFNARAISEIERKRVALETEREKLTTRTQEILEGMSDGFFAVDADGRFTHVNQHAEQLWGKPRGSLLGQPAPEELTGMLGGLDLATLQDAGRNGVPKHYDTFSPASQHWFHVDLYPQAGGGVACFFRDVTERKTSEAQLQQAKDEAERASRVKSEFIATLSHEMRTPLAPVMATLPVIAAHPQFPEELQPLLQSIRRNLELEVHLISDLLDLTRIERGKLQLESNDLDVHTVIESVVGMCRHSDAARIETDLAARRHIVRGDSNRLHQVFLNLVTNAQKFTPPDGRIQIRTASGGADSIRITVSDTGDGIAPDVLPRLFTAFEQGTKSVTPLRAGLGLGLAISRNIVEMHRGTITAASPGPGCGSVFTIELPALSVAALPAAAPPPPDPAGTSAHILLVEDHAPTRQAMSRLLTMLGHRVTAAATGDEARRAAREHLCDLLISDIGLPDETGLQLMQDLRSRFAGRAIALSGFGTEADVNSALNAGFNQHLTKPVQLAMLRQAIARACASDTTSVS